MDFVTLGMFIIDEIHYQPPQKPDIDVMGGAGLYAAVGARLFRSPPSASQIGWVVHQGHDFPSHMKSIIDSWQTSCEFTRTPDRATTRARNRYDSNGHRAFEYLNDKVRVDENSLTLEQLTSKTYHLICSAQRCMDLVKGITARRREAKKYENDLRIRYSLTVDPAFIWEPVPDLCKTSELKCCLDALEYVDVFSPNLEEFCSLLGTSIDLDQSSGWAQLRQKCNEVIEPTTSVPEVAAVIRLGRRGCYVAQPGRPHMRLPAYHQQDRVIDPTGGGNAFLGGFAVALRQTKPPNIAEAALYGTIAASFAIEQVGVPLLELSESGGENWNGDSVESRLRKYTKRIAEECG
ncbi:MAG: hypothetical protein Q9166_007697 [cf. Caloplaca sp. 2 TL-2023]